MWHDDGGASRGNDRFFRPPYNPRFITYKPAVPVQTHPTTSEEEGIRQASYALKLLQSEGEITIASTGKDPATGKLTTHEYRVEGPVMLFMTTTAVTIEDEELQNRCITLSVSEDRAQTRAIHALQREEQTLDGLMAKQDREEIVALHRNAQRLLRPYPVINPYAKYLTFRDDCTRTRRDNMKYLTLIRAIALLHQHQREKKTMLRKGVATEYIEATLADIGTANNLAHEVLGRSLDELSPQTRRFLILLDELVEKECQRLEMDRPDYRFRRREIRAYTGLSDFQVRMHIDKLVSLEYVLVHRGSKGQLFVYELLFDGKGQDGHPRLMGLFDVEKLKKYDYDKKFEHPKCDFVHGKDRFEVGSSPHSAPFEPTSSMGENTSEPINDGASRVFNAKPPENAHLEGKKKKPSYVVVPSCRNDGLAASDVLPLAAVPAVAVPAVPRPAVASQPA